MKDVHLDHCCRVDQVSIGGFVIDCEGCGGNCNQFGIMPTVNEDESDDNYMDDNDNENENDSDDNDCNSNGNVDDDDSLVHTNNFRQRYYLHSQDSMSHSQQEAQCSFPK